MKIANTALALLLALSNTLANEFPKPPEIIQNEGQFVFTDGSSFYLFKKDGTFTSEPLGLSGRVISLNAERAPQLKASVRRFLLISASVSYV